MSRFLAAIVLAVVVMAQPDQHVVATRNAHLRDQPSSAGTSLALLAPPTSLTLSWNPIKRAATITSRRPRARKDGSGDGT